MSNEREITIFTTKGEKIKIQSSATTWGELKSVVENKGFDMNQFKALESVNRTSLESSIAILPTTAFTLFISPIKTKSGVDYNNMNYNDLRNQLSPADKIGVAKFNCKVSWTQCSTLDLKNYFNNLTQTPEPEAVSEQISPSQSSLAILSVENNLAEVVLVIDKNDLTTAWEDLVDSRKYNRVLNLIETYSNSESAQAAIDDREETERLTRELAEINKGF
jgi:hypothetical protein